MSEKVARTVRDFCETYSVSKTKAYELIASGKIEARKAGRRTLILEESARAWVATLPVGLSMRKTQSTTTESEPPRKRQYHKSLRRKDFRTMANDSKR
jgi:excisionase family DNA binding protein